MGSDYGIKVLTLTQPALYQPSHLACSQKFQLRNKVGQFTQQNNGTRETTKHWASHLQFESFSTRN